MHNLFKAFGHKTLLVPGQGYSVQPAQLQAVSLSIAARGAL
jgi:hypothetical protein